MLKNNFLKSIMFSIGLFSSPVFAEGQNEAVFNKDQYHLFNPTPKDRMREMATDRPDKTESPYTVDAGHYQAEISFVDYTYDQDNAEDARSDNFGVLPMNLKAGLLNNVDIQFILDPYLIERTEADGDVEKKSGFGDIQTRVKINFWGNDQGSSAFALMPFVKFPSNTDNLGNDHIEGGLICPLAVSLPAEWNMGIMTEFDFYKNSEKEYYTDFINTITFSHAILGELNGYVEFFSSFNDEEDSRWVGTADTGLTYAVSKDIQLDAGINIGVTRSADQLNPFLGISMRY